MNAVFIHATTPLLAGSRISPGEENEPPGARNSFIADDDFDF